MTKHITATLIALATLAGTAHAQTADCKYQGDPNLPFEDNVEFMAWGSQATYQTYKASASGGAMTVTLSAADPARPISHPWQKQQSETFVDNEITIGPNDGPLKISVEWLETEYREQANQPCRRASERIIETGVGAEPRFSRESSYTRYGYFYFPGNDKCFEYRQTSFRLVIDGPGGREELYTASPCDEHYTTKGNNKLFALRGTSKGAKITAHKRRSNRSYRLRYTAFIGGKVVKRGRVVIDHDYSKGYRIYANHPDGSINDDYWNTCVNDGRDVWMHNGNPYCYEPTYRDTDLKIR